MWFRVSFLPVMCNYNFFPLKFFTHTYNSVTYWGHITPLGGRGVHSYFISNGFSDFVNLPFIQFFHGGDHFLQFLLFVYEFLPFYEHLAVFKLQAFPFAKPIFRIIFNSLHKALICLRTYLGPAGTKRSKKKVCTPVV